MEIKLEKVNEKVYKVITSNDLNIGTFELDVDGFWHFWNTDYIAGSWSSHSLRTIADKLDEINKPYKEVVDEYFKQENLTVNCSCGDGVKELGENYCRSCLNKNPFLCT